MHVSSLKTKNNKNEPATYSKGHLQSAVNMASPKEGTSQDQVRNLVLWWWSLPVHAWPRPLPCPPASTQPVLLSSGHRVSFPAPTCWLDGHSWLHLEINTGMMTPWCDWEKKADVTATLVMHRQSAGSQSCARAAPAPALLQRCWEAPTHICASCTPSKLTALSRGRDESSCISKLACKWAHNLSWGINQVENGYTNRTCKEKGKAGRKRGNTEHWSLNSTWSPGTGEDPAGKLVKFT